MASLITTWLPPRLCSCAKTPTFPRIAAALHSSAPVSKRKGPAASNDKITEVRQSFVRDTLPHHAVQEDGTTQPMEPADRDDGGLYTKGVFRRRSTRASEQDWRQRRGTWDHELRTRGVFTQPASEPASRSPHTSKRQWGKDLVDLHMDLQLDELLNVYNKSSSTSGKRPVQRQQNHPGNAHDDRDPGMRLGPNPLTHLRSTR
ncbi:hypothetical protein K525DRAFT_240062 [Schizophyllum commune Loenen D]|nr:hypothetical protein K525DRAFT_240062 [Schizophyllum commune Loenen D]